MNGSVQFRLARSEDLPAIIAMLADDVLGQAREASPSTPVYGKAFEAIEAQPGNNVFVAERDGNVVATAQLTLIPNLSLSGTLRAQIEGVRVATTERGQGTGEAMFQWLIDRAREEGAGLVQLTTNKSREDAFRFYERLGFVASREGFKLKLDQQQ